MQEASTRDLDRLMEGWDELVRRFPGEKRALLERLGPKMLQAVRQQIGGSGKVAGWQAPYMGSGGGYTGVRARADTYQTTKGGKRYAVGYITNRIEGGHRISKPRGGKNYTSRVQVAAVPGLWFYDAVRQGLPSMAQGEISDLLEIITAGLEGRL